MQSFLVSFNPFTILSITGIRDIKTKKYKKIVESVDDQFLKIYNFLSENPYVYY